MDFSKYKRPVDLVKVQEMIGPGLDLFSSLVEIFTEEANIQIADIEKSILNKDSAALDHSAHIFKSSLATLGALDASRLAGRLEIIGKVGSVDGSGEIFEELKAEQARVTAYFESKEWIKDWELSI